MTAIIGLDLSLASTGLARITTDADATAWVAETWCRPSSPPPTRSLSTRAERVSAIASDTVDYATPCDLVVMEGPSFGSVSSSAVDRYWLWGAVISELIDREITVAEIPPKTRAKFATGTGSADKAAVARAVTTMWPDWVPSVPHGVSDQADALVLASIGVVLAGLDPVPFAMPDYRSTALAKTPPLEVVTS